MKFDFDVIIVGAGLGGVCAALSLRQRGARVALIEAAVFPRHKVCGEFLSPEIRRTFARLNVENDVLESAPPAIESARIVVSQANTQSQSSTRSATQTLEIALPRGAVGVSRFALDLALWQAAQNAGAEVFAPVRARKIERNGAGFTVETSSGEMRARFVIAAPGRNARFAQTRFAAETVFDELKANVVSSKDFSTSLGMTQIGKPEKGLIWENAISANSIEYSNRNENANRNANLNTYKNSVGATENATAENATNARRYIGFKTHFANVRGVNNAVELYPFDGGYCGVGEIENGLTNVCLLARYETVNGRAPEIFWDDLLQNCPALAQRLGDATPMFSWLATANVSFGRKQPTRNDGVLFCGDAGGYIHPLTGDGMAMAARSGELAAAILGASLRGHLPDEDVAPLYARAWNREFSSRLKWAARLEPLLLQPQLARFAVQTLNRAPQLARRAVQLTRG